MKNNFNLIEQIGKGGFSKTYLSEDENKNKYAIKKISIEKNDFKLLEIIEREIEFIKKISHPNIPKFFSSFQELNGKYNEVNIVQEYIDGQNLYQLIKDGKTFTEFEVIKILIQVCKILEFLHNFNPMVIHRDIKPSNIMIDKQGKIYLIDFGAIKEKVSFEYTSKSGLSTIIGTQGYMPIEQFENRVNPQSDIYSLGLTAIYLLTKKEPLELPKNGLQIDFEPYVNISNNLFSILSKMTEPDYTERYKSINHLKKDLYSLENKRPLPSKITHEEVQKYLEPNEKILQIKKPKIKHILRRNNIFPLMFSGSIVLFISFIASLILIGSGIGFNLALPIVSSLIAIIIIAVLIGIGLISTPYYAIKYAQTTDYILTDQKIILLPKVDKLKPSLFTLPIRIISTIGKNLVVFNNIKKVVSALPTVLIRILEYNVNPDEISEVEANTNNVRIIYYHKLKDFHLEKIEYKDGSGDLIFYYNRDEEKAIYMKLICVNNIGEIEKHIINKLKEV